jgi:hypothetical protein
MLRRLSLGFLCAALVAACGSARYVERTQYGGTIALNGDRNKAMEQADKMMTQHCGPGNYTVLREGEVPVGTDTVSRSDTSYGEDTATNRRGTRSSTEGGATTTSGTSTRTATEWRVQYQCGQGAGAPPPPPPGPAPAPPPGPAPEPAPEPAPGY